jgi:hypothetical protein
LMTYQIFTGKQLFGAQESGHTSEQVMNNILVKDVEEHLFKMLEPWSSVVSICVVRSATLRVRTADELIAIADGKPHPQPGVYGVKIITPVTQQSEVTRVLKMEAAFHQPALTQEQITKSRTEVLPPSNVEQPITINNTEHNGRAQVYPAPVNYQNYPQENSSYHPQQNTLNYPPPTQNWQNQQTGFTGPSAYRREVPGSVATLVLGIISCVFFLSFISLACGIIALIISARSLAAYKRNPGIFTIQSYNKARYGNICAIIGTIISFIFCILFIFSLS